MARKRRIQFPGGIYHVMSRGNRKETMFENDNDRRWFLSVIGEAAQRYEVRICEFCLMGTHYHLLLFTPRGNLSAAMQYINGVSSQASNRRHRRTGHLLEGRFKSIVVPRERYLKRVSRYVVLNPVKAGLVPDPARWTWSSYGATAGLREPEPFLCSEWLMWAFSAESVDRARRTYRQYVRQGFGDRESAAAEALQTDPDVLEELARADYRDRVVPRVCREQVRPPLAALFRDIGDPTARKLRIYEAHITHGYRLTEIAAFLNLRPSTPGIMLRRLRARSFGSAEAAG